MEKNLTRQQVKKILNDYQIRRCEYEHFLSKLSLKRKYFNSRLKLVNRKILILKNKLNEAQEDIINFSCDDFDDLDLFL